MMFVLNIGVILIWQIGFFCIRFINSLVTFYRFGNILEDLNVLNRKNVIFKLSNMTYFD